MASEKQTTTGRALVLGGGGQVGRAWLLGLLGQLLKEGIRLPQADLIIGTSAGSQVGAQLALGTLDLDRPPVAPALYVHTSAQPTDAFTQLYALMAQAVVSDNPELIRQAIGQQALQAPTLSEAQARQRLAYLQGYPWPANFRATAVRAETGEFVLWDQQAHIALIDGVASSSALPGALPPVTIGQQRYVDGGVRSMLNADLAVGKQHVLVVSCFSLAVSSANTPQDVLNRGLLAEVELLRQHGSVVDVLEPNAEFLQLTQNGTQMLNLALMPEAWQVGKRQAESEQGRLATAWRAV